jgi:hypothetical protein
MATTYTSAALFVRMVGDFAARTPSWSPDRINHFVGEDEINDMTLVALRVYGRREEFLAVMAAAGLDSPTEPLPQRRLVLPSSDRLSAMKKLTGYVSRNDERTEEQAADPVGSR